MPAILERIIGIVLTLTAAIGLVLNIGALIFIPGIEATAQTSIRDTIMVLDTTLTTTTEGLDVVTESLDNAQTTLTAVADTTRTVGITINDTRPAVQVVRDLSATALPQTIAGTRSALQVASASAAGIDAVLLSLAGLNVFGAELGVEYDPDTSLAASLTEVDASLAPLESSFTDISTSLETADGNLAEVNTQITSVADSLGQFDATITQAKTVTAQYRTVVAQQQQVLRTLETQILPGVTWGVRGIIALLIWLAVAQLGLLAQGIEMIGRSGRRMDHKPVGDLA